ncbi:MULTISPECIES: choice-of-anchor A family protein [Pseudoalteromonas]|uniref:choice-of-anchor A family protein n=1 Tax=Pseudoalteromonas TaxID=53246 RepID=UPI000C4897CB|nr:MULTISPECIES: choice-of-anchor A family protein [Pseudoalteromonas]MAY60023.1 hemolysin [Pseudoalteromonas sp.]MDN3407796.1 choice-of-anchor A family protein [Pseudoalteromonas sp. APC 3894]MDN3415436.1 choice-of-anchor A family protein [Pseudoalteromonas sp. APC 3227]MDN3419104.1 choice-of-anchor A family protein [Pseudoalteromonas sp. APC 3895]MDN3422503.1 choice-of-anchor A family protein [Pseudoalteromonas sp. APC 3896]|tara:strand:+ start:27128 stop:29329 length:2202 start_codon:yes stop_codon:yes gene_type:complete
MTNSLLKFKKISAVIALSLASSTTLAADLGVANNFSAFVFNDFKSNFGRADGAIAAGEIDLKGYSVGYTRPYNPEEYYLISESTIDFKYGRQYVGSMVAGGGTDVHWSVRWGMEWGSKILSNQDESALPFNFDEQEQYYKDLSAQLSELDETGTVYRKWGGLYLQGDGSSDRQVFNLDARDFAKAHTFKVWGIPADATVIFNITGDDNVVVKGKSFARLRHHASKTVFNFTNAQKLDIKGNRWQGVILAPYADIRGVYGTAKMPIIGQSFYGSMALLGGEFDGDLPSLVQPIAPFTMQQKWHWNSSDFLPESNQVITMPVTAQLNDDNGDGVIDNKDVADVLISSFITNTESGILRALNGTNGSELWSYSTGAISVDAGYTSAVADVDNDGIVEIIATDSLSNSIKIVNHKGELIKSIEKKTAGLIKSNVALSDVNNDGKIDILAGDGVYSIDGEFLYSYLWTPSPIAVDINDDGYQEVVADRSVFDVNGVPLWSFGTYSRSWFSSVGNFDEDDDPEILVSIPNYNTSRNSLTLFEADGNIKWELANLDNIGGGVQSISSFFENGETGIVYSGYLSVDMYNTNGELVWSVANDDEFSGKIGVNAYDFNGDGIDEVIVQDHYKVRVLNSINGEILSSIPNSSATLWEYPIVVDLEGDNNAELITVSNNYDSRYSINNGVTVYGAADSNKPWKNATRIWNQHSYHQTNINQDGTVPTVELPSWLNNNTYRSSTLK